MTNDYKALAILRNAKVDGVEAPELDYIPKLLQFVENQVEIPSVRKHQVADILKEEQARVEHLDRIDENWETVSGIVHALLFSTDTKRLARRTANDNVGGRIFESDLKFHLFTRSVQIVPIGLNRRRNHFKAMSFEASSLETERKPATTCEQIDYLCVDCYLRYKEI